MTNEQIRIEIAEACGWVRETRSMYAGSANVAGWGKNLDLPEGHRDRQFVLSPDAFPDFCNDLNAMHEAEMLLDNPVWVIPGTILKGSLSLYDVYSGELSARFGRNIRATALQRAEAFLRTIGKWKE